MRQHGWEQTGADPEVPILKRTAFPRTFRCFPPSAASPSASSRMDGRPRPLRLSPSKPRHRSIVPSRPGGEVIVRNAGQATNSQPSTQEAVINFPTTGAESPFSQFTFLTSFFSLNSCHLKERRRIGENRAPAPRVAGNIGPSMILVLDITPPRHWIRQSPRTRLRPTRSSLATPAARKLTTGFTPGLWAPLPPSAPGP